jgi:hypothetical protein
MKGIKLNIPKKLNKTTISFKDNLKLLKRSLGWQKKLTEVIG